MHAIVTLFLAVAPATLVVPEVDELEVTAVVDNFYDCFQKDEKCAVRLNLGKVDGFDGIRVQAEMGLAYLVRARVGAAWHTVLFDFALSASVYENNLKKLGLDISNAEALVLSHAHEDHYAGLLFAKTKSKAPVFVGNSDAFLPRRFVSPGRSWDMGTLSRKALSENGGVVTESPAPRVVAASAIVSGLIPQKTPYEKVPAFLKMQKGSEWVQDPMTHELALAYRVRGKGLVVLTSCAHAGVINTLEHFRALTGEPRVLAVIGGMHLTSAPDEQVAATVDALLKLRPQFVAPMHCTGNRATEALMTQMKEAYVHPSVGTRYQFKADGDGGLTTSSGGSP